MSEEFDPGQLSPTYFDRRIADLEREVAGKRASMERSEAELAWWRKGRELFVGPMASNSDPTSLGEAILAVMQGAGPLRVQELSQRLLAQGWIEDSKEARHALRSRVWSMAHRSGQLEQVRRGTYQLASRNGAASDARTGPTEHEATEPLLTATEPQVADSDS